MLSLPIMLYPTYMSMASFFSEAEVPVYSAMPQGEFMFDTSSLYHSDAPLLEQTTVSSMSAPLRATSGRLGKRGSLDSSASDMGAMSLGVDGRGATPPTKRSRREPLPSGRVAGACTRCKRLKVTTEGNAIMISAYDSIVQMKCTFADSDTTCARCIVGGHECVVLGRKPRSPG